MVGVDGRSYTQRKEDKESNETESEVHADYDSKDKIFTQSFSSSQQQLEQDNRIEEHTDNIENHSKDTSYNGLKDNASEDSEKPLDEQQQQLTVDIGKISNVSDNNATPITDSDILHFEVFKSLKFVQDLE